MTSETDTPSSPSRKRPRTDEEVKSEETVQAKELFKSWQLPSRQPSDQSILNDMKAWTALVEANKAKMQQFGERIAKLEYRSQAIGTIEWLWKTHITPHDPKLVFHPDKVQGGFREAKYVHDTVNIHRYGREKCVKGDYNVFYTTTIWVGNKMIYVKYDN